MAKAEGKRTQSAAQKRAQADFKAYHADHGHGPPKGVSIKGYAGGRSPGASTRKKNGAPRAQSNDAATAGRRRGARKAAKTRAKLTWKVKNWVKRHPVATTALVGTATGGAVLAASPEARQSASNGLARARAVLSS